MITLTLHDGRILDIHESAWAKFFDTRLQAEPNPGPDDIGHGRLVLSFAVPGTKRAGGQMLDVQEGAMIVMSENGRFSLTFSTSRAVLEWPQAAGWLTHWRSQCGRKPERANDRGLESRCFCPRDFGPLTRLFPRGGQSHFAPRPSQRCCPAKLGQSPTVLFEWLMLQ